MRTLESDLASEVEKLEAANQSAQDKLCRIEADNKQKLDKIREVLQQELKALKDLESERDSYKQRARSVAGEAYSGRGPSYGSLHDLSNEQLGIDTSGRSGDTGSRSERREYKEARVEQDGLQSVISSILKGKK